MNIESMDAFNFLCIIDYIFYSRPDTILYSMLALFTAIESKLIMQAGLEKAQWGSSSTIRNKVCFEIL